MSIHMGVGSIWGFIYTYKNEEWGYYKKRNSKKIYIEEIHHRVRNPSSLLIHFYFIFPLAICFSFKVTIHKGAYGAYCLNTLEINIEHTRRLKDSSMERFGGYLQFILLRWYSALFIFLPKHTSFPSNKLFEYFLIIEL